MSNAVAGQVASNRLFELKSSSLTVPVLRLFSSDIDAVSAQLSQQVDRTPEFFLNAPIVIDLSAVTSMSADVDLALLVGLIRGLGMLAVGVKGGSELQNEAATMLEVAVLGRTPGRTPVKASTATDAKAGARVPSQPAATTKTKIVQRPVRSGQRVYARGSDLVVLAAVSSGAEIFADGNIHVYGPLRGRAMAGIKGDSEARIFCSSLGAELVSIAGRYQLSERLSREHWGESVQIYLNENRLVVEPV